MSLLNTTVYANNTTPCFLPSPVPTQVLSSEFPQGTNGGTAPSILTFNPYPINAANPPLNAGHSTVISGLSVTSNVMSLPPGTYSISGAVGHAMDNGQARLFDVSGSNELLLGTVAGADGRTAYSTLDGIVSLSTTTNVQIELAGAALTGGDADYGQALGVGVEKFMTLKIQLIGR